MRTAGSAAAESPAVIFQEVVAGGQQLQAKLDTATADLLAAKVAGALRDMRPLPTQAGSIDLGRETALAADARLAAVQKRIRDVLFELEARGRMEGTRLRETIAQTEEAVKADLKRQADAQLISQQEQLQVHMEEQMQAVMMAAKDAVKKRNHAYNSYLSALFDETSQRAQEYGAVHARVLAAEEALKRKSALEGARSELAGKYALDANSRIQQAEDLNLRLNILEGVLEDGAGHTQRSRSLQLLSVAVEAALHRLSRDEQITDDLQIVASSSDPVVQVVMRPLAAKRGETLPTKDQLLADFERNLGNARRALLVPPGSGVLGETLASIRALTLGALTDTELPEVTTPESRLRRARVLLQRGDVAASVAEIGQLPAKATQALDGYVTPAKERLLVEQSLRVIRAHVTSNLASLA